MIYRISLFHRDARKAVAPGEGHSADARHAVGDRDARKAGAIEGILADSRQALGNIDARKAGAIIEGILADARHTSVRRDNAVFASSN